MRALLADLSELFFWLWTDLAPDLAEGYAGHPRLAALASRVSRALWKVAEGVKCHVKEVTPDTGGASGEVVG